MSTQSRRQALVEAMIPSPSAELPALAALDLAPFWQRFDEAAPAHLRFGLALAAWLIGSVLARLLRGRALAELGPDDQDAVLQRAAALPGFDQLLLVAKLVACLAWFDDDTADRQVKEQSWR